MMIFNPLFIDSDTKKFNIQGANNSSVDSHLFKDIIRLEEQSAGKRVFNSGKILPSLLSDVTKIKNLVEYDNKIYKKNNELYSQKILGLDKVINGTPVSLVKGEQGVELIKFQTEDEKEIHSLLNKLFSELTEDHQISGSDKNSEFLLDAGIISKAEKIIKEVEAKLSSDDNVNCLISDMKENKHLLLNIQHFNSQFKTEAESEENQSATESKLNDKYIFKIVDLGNISIDDQIRTVKEISRIDNAVINELLGTEGRGDNKSLSGNADSSTDLSKNNLSVINFKKPEPGEPVSAGSTNESITGQVNKVKAASAESESKLKNISDGSGTVKSANQKSDLSNMNEQLKSVQSIESKEDKNPVGIDLKDNKSSHENAAGNKAVSNSAIKNMSKILSDDDPVVNNFDKDPALNKQKINGSISQTDIGSKNLLNNKVDEEILDATGKDKKLPGNEAGNNSVHQKVNANVKQGKTSQPEKSDIAFDFVVKITPKRINHDHLTLLTSQPVNEKYREALSSLNNEEKINHAKISDTNVNELKATNDSKAGLNQNFTKSSSENNSFDEEISKNLNTKPENGKEHSESGFAEKLNDKGVKPDVSPNRESTVNKADGISAQEKKTNLEETELNTDRNAKITKADANKAPTENTTKENIEVRPENKTADNVKVESPAFTTQTQSGGSHQVDQKIVKVHLNELSNPELTNKLSDEIHELVISRRNEKAVLSLEPKNLGKIKISIELVDNQLTARLDVENSSVRDILQNQVEFLKENLSNSGLQLNSLNIHLQNPENKNDKTTGKGKRGEGEVKEVKVDKEGGEVKETKSFGYNTYEFIA